MKGSFVFKTKDRKKMSKACFKFFKKRGLVTKGGYGRTSYKGVRDGLLLGEEETVSISR